MGVFIGQVVANAGAQGAAVVAAKVGAAAKSSGDTLATVAILHEYWPLIFNEFELAPVIAEAVADAGNAVGGVAENVVETIGTGLEDTFDWEHADIFGFVALGAGVAAGAAAAVVMSKRAKQQQKKREAEHNKILKAVVKAHVLNDAQKSANTIKFMELKQLCALKTDIQNLLGGIQIKDSHSYHIKPVQQKFAALVALLRDIEVRMCQISPDARSVVFARKMNTAAVASETRRTAQQEIAHKWDLIQNKLPTYAAKQYKPIFVEQLVELFNEQTKKRKVFDHSKGINGKSLMEKANKFQDLLKKFPQEVLNILFEEELDRSHGYAEHIALLEALRKIMKIRNSKKLEAEKKLSLIKEIVEQINQLLAIIRQQPGSFTKAGFRSILEVEAFCQDMINEFVKVNVYRSVTCTETTTPVVVVKPVQVKPVQVKPVQVKPVRWILRTYVQPYVVRCRVN